MNWTAKACPFAIHTVTLQKLQFPKWQHFMILWWMTPTIGPLTNFGLLFLVVCFVFDQTLVEPLYHDKSLLFPSVGHKQTFPSSPSDQISQPHSLVGNSDKKACYPLHTYSVVVKFKWTEHEPQCHAARTCKRSVYTLVTITRLYDSKNMADIFLDKLRRCA